MQQMMSATLRKRVAAPSRYVSGAFVVLLHALILGALLQIASVRSRAADAAPVFVKLVSLATPSPERSPPPPPKRVVSKQPPRRVTSDVQMSAPAHFVATEAVAEPVIAPVAAEIMAEPVTSPAPASSAPRTISKVEYIRPPQVEYPALSRRIGEQGRVLLRVLIGREGRAERVEVQVSSGSQRLDDAAVKAAREALYRPYAENGVAISVWALVPTSFELS